MRKTGLIFGFLVVAAPAAWAQSEPPTPQQLMQQNDATIQRSNGALAQSMAQQQQSQIEQEQRQQQATNPIYGNVPYPAYLQPLPPPKPPATPKPAPSSN